MPERAPVLLDETTPSPSSPAVSDPNPNVAATADLAAQLDGAVLMGHSQTGRLPLEAALENPAGVRGMILVEPGGCGSDRWTDEEIDALAKTPILVVFGDHLACPSSGFLGHLR